MRARDSLPIKYRPKTLKTFMASPQTTNLVRGMLHGEIVRTIMISGSTGSGKTTLARILAAHFNCKNISSDLVACGECESCTGIYAGKGQDVHEVNCASDRGIDAAKQLAVNAQYSPRGNFRVFILDESHSLTPQAWQSLLKVIEEPASSTVFIVCTSEPQAVPDTIRGRTLHIKLKPHSPEAIVGLLKRVVTRENADELSEEAYSRIAQASEGSARQALMMLEAVLLSSIGAADAGELEAVIKQVTEASPAKLARAWLTALHADDAFDALTVAAWAADVAVPFIDAAVRMNGHLLRGLSDAEPDPYYSDLAHIKIDPATVVVVSQTLLEAHAAIKSFTAPDHHALLLTHTLKAVGRTFEQSFALVDRSKKPAPISALAPQPEPATAPAPVEQKPEPAQQPVLVVFTRAPSVEDDKPEAVEPVAEKPAKAKKPKKEKVAATPAATETKPDEIKVDKPIRPVTLGGTTYGCKTDGDIVLVVVKQAGKDGFIKRTEIRTLVTFSGYELSNMSAAISNLVKSGRLELDKDGSPKITAEGTDRLDTLAVKQPEVVPQP